MKGGSANQQAAAGQDSREHGRNTNSLQAFINQEMDTARKNSTRKDHHRSLSSLGASISPDTATQTDLPIPLSTHEDEKLETKSDGGSDSNEDEKDLDGLTKEEQIKMQRQREKRLAMNRASARERRKRKRILIEELQDKSQKLALANLNLRKMNEELVGQVAQLSAILTASQPALAAPFLAGSRALPGVADATASLMASTGANALVALQQQEIAKALLGASSDPTRAAASAQISGNPLAPGVTSNALAPGVSPVVPSVQELAQLQQRALLAQQMGAGMGAANQLLASILGPGAATAPPSLQRASSSDAASSSSLPPRRHSGQLPGTAEVPGVAADHSSKLDALQLGHTALGLLRAARASSQSTTPEKSFIVNKESGETAP